MNEDPFSEAKDDVNRDLREIYANYEEWKRLCHSGSMPQINESKKRLKSKIEDLQEYLIEMDEALDLLKKDIKKFNIDQNELNSRRSFVSNIRKKLRDINDDLEVPFENNHYTGSVNAKAKKAQDMIRKKNDKFLDDQEYEQERIFMEQDKKFDHLHGTIKELSGVGKTMNEHLEYQIIALEDMSNETDQTNEMIASATSNVDRIIGKMKANTGWLCIIILIVVFVVVSFLAFSL